MNFLSPAVFSSACSVLILLSGVSFAQEYPPPSEGPPPVTIQPITMDVMLVKGGTGANSGLIVGYKELIAIDAKMSPESVQEMLTEIKKTIPFAVTKVILTHSDADHVSGLPGFPRGITIISQEQVKADLIQASAALPGLQDYLPTQVFKDEMKLQSGRVKILLRHYGPGHTNGDTVVYIDAEKTAYVGDLVFVGRDPVIERSKNGSSSGLVRNLKAILEHRPHIDSFIPGHGDMVTRDEVENLVRSIEVKQFKIRTFIAEGKSLEDIKKILQVEERPSASGAPGPPSLVEVIYQELTEKKDKK
jgi:cyclase